MQIYFVLIIFVKHTRIQQVLVFICFASHVRLPPKSQSYTHRFWTHGCMPWPQLSPTVASTHLLHTLLCRISLPYYKNARQSRWLCVCSRGVTTLSTRTSLCSRSVSSGSSVALACVDSSTRRSFDTLRHRAPLACDSETARCTRDELFNG